MKGFPFIGFYNSLMKPTRIQTLITYTLVAFLGIYFMITFSATMPTTYLKIDQQDFYSKFDKVLYQRWNFFAPPPKSNYRLYFEYRSKQDSSVQVKLEVLEGLLKAKKEKAPFNSFEEIMDYQLYGCINIITTLISDITKRQRYLYPDSSDQYIIDQSIETYNVEYSRGPEFKSLTKYAKLCAVNEGFYSNMIDPQLKITITVQDLPSFSETHSSQAKKEELQPKQERFVFKSEFVDL